MKFLTQGRVRPFLASLAVLCLLLPGFGDDAGIRRRLTNQDIIAMVSAGISQDVILTKIQATSASGSGATNFDTSVEGLKALKAASVPDAIIKAMIDPAPASPTVVSVAGAATLNPNLPPPEVGVYWKDGANFVLIQGRQSVSRRWGARPRTCLPMASSRCTGTPL